MNVPKVSDATIEVCRYLVSHPDLTDYQLNRHVINAHGPEAVLSVPRELTQLGLAEAKADAAGWKRWRITAEGERAASITPQE
jgi:hypothetical protein